MDFVDFSVDFADFEDLDADFSMDFADFNADFTDFGHKTSKTDNQFSFHSEDPRGKHQFFSENPQNP